MAIDCTAFLAHVNGLIRAYYRQEEYKSAPPVVTMEPGAKYGRFVRTAPGERSSYGFVNLETGELLKSASWKGPAKGVRGTLSDPASWSCASVYSIR